MRRDTWLVGARMAVLLGALVPGLALAAIGRVEVLEGTARRTPDQGTALDLKPGSEIEVKDLLTVGPKSNLKLVLNDGSVIMLGAGSELFISQADFEGQERKGFVAKLGLGKFWASVKKALAGSSAKFEVETDRAVAGVRGTQFRVDAAAPAVKGALSPSTLVQVVEGQVRVTARVRKPTPVAGTPPTKLGERVEVSGPREVSVEEWEEAFIELQANQQVRVSGELGQPRTTALDRKVANDPFGRFVNRNQKPGSP